MNEKKILTGKELILATKAFASEVRWKSWAYTISTLFILVVLISGDIFLQHWWLRLPCSILTGLVFVRFFVIYHDHQHHAILNKSFIADVIFKSFGIFILVPASIWKRTHDYHHAHNSKLATASIGSFPIFTKEQFLNSSKKIQRGYLIIRHPITIALGYFSVFFFGMSVQSFFTNPAKHWDSMVAIIFHVAFTVCTIVFFGWMMWLYLILIPFMVASALGAYLFYAQHNFPDVEFKGEIEWSYDHAALDSSSFMKMNFFWNFMTANIGYHHVHHMNSRIPFYRLPEAMKAIPELQKVKITTLRIKDIVACFRLKVWDPQLNKMTGVPIK